jgi:hypothetical protein
MLGSGCPSSWASSRASLLPILSSRSRMNSLEFVLKFDITTVMLLLILLRLQKDSSRQDPFTEVPKQQYRSATIAPAAAVTENYCI